MQDLEESDIEQARRMAPVAFSGVVAESTSFEELAFDSRSVEQQNNFLGSVLEGI